jgi:NADPH-dependent ferric siderophore reductase
MLPHGYAPDSPLIRQLCAEELRTTDKGQVWVQTYRHNHQLDLAGYADAALEWLYARQAADPATPASQQSTGGVVGSALG